MIHLKVSLGQDILNKMPSFKIGLNHYTKITVSESPQMLKGRLQLFQEQLFFEVDDKELTELPSIHEWRNIWRIFGANPNQYPPSIEALIRKIKKQNYLSPFNSAVDMNNFLSLQYEIPISIYDTKFIDGDIMFHIGEAENAFEGINHRMNQLGNLITSSDHHGAFGSPYVDSKRTATTEQTTSALQVFFLHPSMANEEATELLHAAGKMFTTIHSGDVNSNVLHKDQKTVMLN